LEEAFVVKTALQKINLKALVEVHCCYSASAVPTQRRQVNFPEYI
jgi:hypothetical protein